MYKIPLSPYSKIFYYEWLIHPKSSRHNMCLTQILHGTLDIEYAKATFKRYVADHVLMNSHIKNSEECFNWVINDLIYEVDYSENFNYHDTLKYINESFDLEKGPLYRFKIIKIDERQHILVIVFHHILVDGMSLDEGGIRTLTRYYNDISYHNENNIDSQINLITNLSNNLSEKLNASRETSKSFWDKALEYIDCVDMKALRTRNFSARQTDIKMIPDEIKFELNEDVIEKLNLLKHKYLITPYLFSQAVLAIILQKYTGQQNFAISYPVAIKEGINIIYGAHVNTSLIPYKFNEQMTVKDLLEQSRSFVKSLKSPGISHSYYPITDILSSHNKEILNVFHIQANFKSSTFEFDGIEKVETLNEFNVDTMDFLLFEQELKDNMLRFRIRYDRTFFDAEILNYFVDGYQKLFTEIADDLLIDQHRQINQYSPLNDDTYFKLIYRWDHHQRIDTTHKPFHQLFEEQVVKTPNSIALIYQNRKITYSDLNSQANQLAHYLRHEHNIKGDDLVTLFLDKSDHMIIAILGVLKASGAYIPIDPQIPDDRITYILSDTRTQIILTDQVNHKKISGLLTNNSHDLYQKPAITTIDSKENLFQSFAKDNPTIKVNDRNLAYVIYTSGTTGKPKGVMIEHRSLSMFLLGFYKNLGSAHNLNTISTTGYSFDIFGLEYGLPLIKGYTVELVRFSNDSINSINPINLTDVGFIQLTPSKLELFADRIDYNFNFDHNKPKEIFFLLGGEALNSSTLRLITQIESRFNYTIKIKLMNVYGPTEATIWSTSRTIDVYKEPEFIGSIGLPLPNETCYILDQELLPVPIGGIGELYIGGIGLARGYLNMPELTAEKFIKNPFQTREEEKVGENSFIYKTGDLTRYLPDGNIEYIGRTDFQVKVRGYRVELTEIEEHLMAFPLIKQAVVLNRTHPRSNFGDYLVGYYVADLELNESSIVKHLAKSLPEYMIPSALVHLQALPLNTNGKLERKALPLPVFNDDYLAPRSHLEKEVCQIFAQCLKIDIKEIGIKDDFFRLGGNSIAAINLINQLNNHFNVYLKVVQLVDHRTVEKVAEIIEHFTTNESIIFSLNQSNSEEYMFMIHPAHGGCEVYKDLANNLSDKYRCLGIDNYNFYSKTKIDDLYNLASYYLQMIKQEAKISQDMPIKLLGWSLGGRISLEIAGILEKEGYSDIQVYLLDTFIWDNQMKESYSQIDSKILNDVAQMYIEKNYNLDFAKLVSNNYNLDIKLTDTPVTDKLAHSKVKLFKAKKEIPGEYFGESYMHNYMLNLTANNIDQVVSEQTQLNIIQIENSHHWDIVNAPEIVQQIIND